MIEFINNNNNEDDPEFQNILKKGVAQRRIGILIGVEIFVFAIVAFFITLGAYSSRQILLGFGIVPFFICGFFTLVSVILMFFTHPKHVWIFCIVNLLLTLTSLLFINSLSSISFV